MHLAIVLLAATSTLSLEDRTEVRSRISGSKVAFDAETDPSFKHRILAQHGDDDFSYFFTPRLILTHFAEESRNVELLTAGGFQLQSHRGRTNIAILQVGTYGTASASSLFIQPQWNGEGAPATVLPVPVDLALRFTLVSSQSAVVLSRAVSRRFTTIVTGTFGAYGGPDNQSQKTLPLTYGPGAELKLQYTATRQDDVTVGAGVNYTKVTVAKEDASPLPAVRAFGELRLRHRWSTLASTDLAAGAVIGHQGLADTFYPTAELITEIAFRQRAARAAVVFVARIAPWLDPFTASLEQRAEGALAASWNIGLDTLRVQGAVQQVIPTAASPVRFALAYGELSFEHKLSRTFFLDAGVRGAAERSSTETTNASTEQVLGFVGATWRPLPAKL